MIFFILMIYTLTQSDLNLLKLMLHIKIKYTLKIHKVLK